MPGGTVMFYPADSKYNPASAKVDENGNYSATVTAGEARISVDNRALKNPDAGGDEIVPTPGSTGKIGGPPKGALGPPKGALEGAMQGKSVPKVAREKLVGTYIPIPDKYSRPDLSELKVTVKSGAQTHNIELK